jgi:hypothetical protein
VSFPIGYPPVQASWINQIEIYFSIVQRKVLTPNDFSSLPQLEHCLIDFQKRYEQTASPFQGTSRPMIFALCWESYNPERPPLRPEN